MPFNIINKSPLNLTQNDTTKTYSFIVVVYTFDILYGVLCFYSIFVFFNSYFQLSCQLKLYQDYEKW